MKNFEVGTPVKVTTQAGICEGIICFPIGFSNKNQFFVTYSLNGIFYSMPFSKLTGKAYGRNPAKLEGHFIKF